MSVPSIHDQAGLKSYLNQPKSSWHTIANNTEACERIYKIVKNTDILNLKDSSGNTLMHVIAYAGMKPLAEKLLGGHKVNWNIQNKDGNTPLHIAAMWGRKSLVSLLVENKTANQTITNNNRQFPVDEAYQKKEIETAKLFSQTAIMQQVQSWSIPHFKPPIERVQKFEQFKTFFTSREMKVCVWGAKGTGRHQFIVNFLSEYLRCFHSSFTTCKWVKSLPEKSENDQLVIYTSAEDILFDPDCVQNIKKLILISRTAIECLPNFELGPLEKQVAEGFITKNTNCTPTHAEFIAKRLLYLPLALASIVRGLDCDLNDLAENWETTLPVVLKSQHSVLNALRERATLIVQTRKKQDSSYDAATKILCMYKEMYPELSDHTNNN